MPTGNEMSRVQYLLQTKTLKITVGGNVNQIILCQTNIVLCSGYCPY